MKPSPMSPFGKALISGLNGTDEILVLERDDGFRDSLPVRTFFMEPHAWAAHDRKAIDLCRGRVLDIGAGAGRHSLVLQECGLQVTALDISPDAVDVMIRRGVRDARCCDILGFQESPYDTVLLLGHGIGMAGTLQDLPDFLAHLRPLVEPGGQLLLDSVNAEKTDRPEHLAYHEANRRAGRYAGDIRMRLIYQEMAGPLYNWLLLDENMLKSESCESGWRCEILDSRVEGAYLARLTPG